MIEKDDWRLHGQDRYLKSETLYYRNYKVIAKEREHDHCEFCWRKFTEDGDMDSINSGYTTSDNYRWICSDCYEDFKDIFNWNLVTE